MNIKRIEETRDLKIGDVVVVVGHDTHNYAENDPLGWFSDVYEVTGQGTYLKTPDCLALQQVKKSGMWPDETKELGEMVDVFNGELGVIRIDPGEDQVEIFLCWRKGEFNDNEEEGEQENE